MFLIQNFKTGLILKLVKIKITLPVLFNIKLIKVKKVVFNGKPQIYTWYYKAANYAQSYRAAVLSWHIAVT